MNFFLNIFSLSENESTYEKRSIKDIKFLVHENPVPQDHHVGILLANYILDSLQHLNMRCLLRRFYPDGSQAWR